MVKGMKRRHFWKKKIPSDDENIIILTDSRPTDVIIPLMGPTGVGKSTFLNATARANVTTVGHDLQSCTAKIEAVVVPYPSKDDPDRRVVFVDTPGFDDTFVEDTEILRRISVWLARSYDNQQKVAGIIYLHDISQTRMFGSTRKNLQLFNQLCGDDALKNVILGTTKWGDIKEDVGKRREGQLAESHWKDMLSYGATMVRFKNTPESAWDIVKLILRKQVTALHIQKELVDLGHILPDTDAGKTLRFTLEEQVKAQKEMASRLANGEGHEDNERYEESRRQLIATLKQIQDLKVPISTRILNMFGL